MRLIIIILLIFLLNSCSIYQPVVVNKKDCPLDMNSLYIENNKLRIEIDYLKNKLSNIKKLYELDTVLNADNYEK